MAPHPLREHVTYDLDEHIGLIEGQFRKSIEDPELRQLAVKIVSGRFEYERHPRSGRSVPVLKAWGETFVAPDMDLCQPRDEQCELEAIWNFVVLNTRYVYDPDDIDFFATARATLEAGGGDCDDLTILIDSLCYCIGFKVGARVISTADNPEEWAHIYPLVGTCTKDNPSYWVPMDTTVKGATPGWQYDDIARFKDYAFEA